MKKITFALYLSLSSLSYALPACNPLNPWLHRQGIFFETSYEPSCERGLPYFDLCHLNSRDVNFGSVRYGYYGDFIYQKRMQISDRDVSEFGSQIDQSSFYTNGGFATLSFFNRVDFSVGIGATSFEIQTPGNSFSTTVRQSVDLYPLVEIHGHPSTSWFLSGNWAVYSTNCMAMGVSGMYFKSNPRMNRALVLIGGDMSSQTYMDNKPQVDLIAWQGAGSISWWLPLSNTNTSGFSPYISYRYSEMSVNFHKKVISTGVVEATFSKIEQVRNAGVSLGVTILANDCASVTIEGRWHDEQALHVDTQIRF